ncbi:glutamine-hydrolyzing GMP synthase [Leptospira wolffii]|uniref:glutamine-hydrolyzing GMP synthase n=1 Tax=Leptospira wolffii TaxID=409998 RepID=UPI0010832D38|nr:glutamine-hydrolyzing GMP synthase [Leptospira wolffii]TGK56869.1 glutamine-hydrolyzing GMP synthase [Leptospira wolffii]TGK71549.1 glutamine-hydrolyzing GMP synthase [Leptospira wolffii]TGK75595.1 glutamine-hydrolyzing GMP synthase [Leptospira wolffii]TGL32916.1 glutamine-hydrolyzing GMP synthase [Leptospira wolffii]
MEHQKVIGIVDFGGQYAHLIASRIRRLGAYSEILSDDEPLETYSKLSGLILSGGPESVYEPDSPSISEKIFELGIPILGICYGHQLMMKLLGGEVKKAGVAEYGRASLDSIDKNGTRLLEGFSGGEVVWMSHGDEVTRLPDGFSQTSSSQDCKYAVVENKEKRWYGIQFHPEVTHTEKGSVLLKNFVRISGAEGTWDLKQYLKLKEEELRVSVPSDKKVFLLVSGGVDSTVCYLLLSQALGKERVKGVLIDTGFMRKNEVSDLQKNLAPHGIHLHVHDASELFYTNLKGKTDPEEKRKIVGNLFLQAQADCAKELGLNSEEWLLGQGTIYPDTIESGGTKHSHTIKTHHNRVEAIQKLMEEGKIVEPIKDLYKDEVRELGNFLGLPKEWTQRHPFPGPGLVVRMIAQKQDSTESVQKELDASLNSSGLKGKLLPVASVGVKGDQRSYANCAVISGTKDWDRLDKISTAVTNQIASINRVVLLLGSEKLEDLSFHFQAIELNKKDSDLLREVDSVVEKILRKRDLYDRIWQMPVVLLPISSKEGEKSVVLRPVDSQEAMTASFFRLEQSVLDELVAEVQKVSGIRYVFYDLTNKPPGTIEWE